MIQVDKCGLNTHKNILVYAGKEKKKKKRDKKSKSARLADLLIRPHTHTHIYTSN